MSIQIEKGFIRIEEGHEQTLRNELRNHEGEYVAMKCSRENPEDRRPVWKFFRIKNGRLGPLDRCGEAMTVSLAFHIGGLAPKSAQFREEADEPSQFQQRSISPHELQRLERQEAIAHIHSQTQSLRPQRINKSSSHLSMMVLGSFITTLGIAAVALAFTVLNVLSLNLVGLIVLAAGSAAMLGGLGLFSAGLVKNQQNRERSCPHMEQESNGLAL